MTEAPIWPDRLRIRDTGLHDDLGGPGQRIYTTAGRGYERQEYVRADLFDALTAERDALRAALEGIAKTKYGLQGIMEDHSDTNAFNYHAMQYWAKLADGYEAQARKALKYNSATDQKTAV